MKSLIALASVAMLAVPAFAGEGHVSNQSLAKMGLSGMKAMADSQGAHIRGLSVAVAGGVGYSTISGVGGSTGELTFYGAADSSKKGGSDTASGDNAAISGDATTTITTKGNYVTTKTTINVIGSGGFSAPVGEVICTQGLRPPIGRSRLICASHKTACCFSKSSMPSCPFKHVPPSG